MTTSPTTVLDLQDMGPGHRHPTILSTFDALSAGQALELVNDHNPTPLRYQLEAELPGTRTWDDLEEGPEAWRVRMDTR